MTNRKLASFITVMVLILSIIGAPEASAQQAATFGELRLLVKTGDKVAVTEVGGSVIEGRIANLSPSALRLRVGNADRNLTEDAVLQIRQRRDDSLRNGAKIGAWVGAAFGVFGIAAICGDLRCAAASLPVMGFYVGTGAAVGVGIDALIVGRQTIFQQPSRGISVSWSF